MKELRDSLGRAVNLIIQDGNDAIYMLKNGRCSAGTRVYGGWKKSTALCWRMSKILLSYFSEEEKRRYIEKWI